MDAQAWVGIGSICAATIGYVIIASWNHSTKLTVVEQRNFELTKVVDNYKRDIDKLKEDVEHVRVDLKREMELHENMNEKTFSNIERKLDDMTKTLMEISGFLKAKNQQNL